MLAVSLTRKFKPKIFLQVFMVPMSLLCVILVLAFLGSTLGCCGKVGGSAKGCGSRFISASLVLFFILGFFLWLFTVILFVSGALTQKLACEMIK